MMLRPLLLLFFIFIAFVATSQSKAADNISSLVGSNTAFAIDIYGQLSKEPGGVVFSPYSISKALAMAYLGARNNTELQMTQVLHVDLGRDRFHRTFGELSRELENNARTGGYEYLSANSLWVQTGYGLQPDFLEVMENAYGSLPKEADFASNPEAQRVSINLWVEERTRARISDLIAPGMISGMTRLVLVNALYFKGKWALKFDDKDTVREDFTTATGEQVNVPFMNQAAEFLYFEDDLAKVLAMDYSQNKFSMVFILPKMPDLRPFEKELTTERLAMYIKGLESQNVHVEIPRFKAGSFFLLNDQLSSLGMSDAFDQARADFSGMNGRKDLFTSYVVHKAFVEVNEEGAEAAAATAVAMTLKSMPMKVPSPKIFRADRPFIFLIRDNESGCILFMGRITDPSRT